jgi:hypothetical protein
LAEKLARVDLVKDAQGMSKVESLHSSPQDAMMKEQLSPRHLPGQGLVPSMISQIVNM